MKYEINILQSILWIAMISFLFLAFMHTPYRIIMQFSTLDVEDVLFFSLYEGFLISGLLILYGIFRIVNGLSDEKLGNQNMIQNLKWVRKGSFCMFFLFFAGMPWIVWIGMTEDAPGAIVIGAVILIASLVLFLLSKVITERLKS